MRFSSLAACLLAAAAQAVVLPSRVGRGSDSSDLQDTAGPVLETRQGSGYWYEDIQKQGRAAFNPNPNGYKVYRNVKDYGARGDGVTDDSAAINAAIADGNRCGPFVCDSATDSPAIVYFPSGTYLIKQRSIIMYYMTQLIGNPNSRPVIKADASLDALAVIDASPYSDQTGEAGWISTNTFARQIRNFEIDLTARPVTGRAGGIHWPASQATTLQNIKVTMTQSSDSVHEGIFVENGSGGHMADIETVGGRYGLNIGNQQFTLKNIKVSRARVGIYQIWNWGWLYQNIQIDSCETAFSMNQINQQSNILDVSSVVIIDSTISNCPTFVDTNWSTSSQKVGANQLIIENVVLNNVPIAVKGAGGATVLQGGSTTIAAWGQGIKYTPNGPERYQSTITPVNRPAGLLDGNKYYSKTKPQYETLGVDSFLSARSAGATGDGTTDDTTALQNAINSAASNNRVLFLECGVYRVTNTINVPPGARIAGEAYPVIMASGSTWSSNTRPVPVVQVGKAGESGHIELSDFIVATSGPTPGAVLIEYNLNTERGSGLWDVHTRIGGAKGTELQVAQCPLGSLNNNCMAAYMNVHITKTGTGAYMENNWFWTADHDLDDPNSTRISVYVGRGLLVEASNVWLYGNGVEHQALYQYQFLNAKDVFGGFLQSETPYWQPTPDAKSQPYPLNPDLGDPDYNQLCPPGTICDAFGLRIVNSEKILLYGAGFYSFYKSDDVSCSSPTAANDRRECQNRMVSIEGSNTSGITMYGLNEVGVINMLTVDGEDKAMWSDTVSGYSNTIGLVQYKI
ncbi:glycoside hydrolase family 55 protein [Periconia macrospinosa]|uniref:Glycoside hydrolase family 55 protein n=1 Tax=Periconia macrospinosa TaxID=97972 RepID=A0A2V1E9K0_9PLEO|nr:glycoside hydrolase family 55 protein [Periconia macrospinosa]